MSDRSDLRRRLDRLGRKKPPSPRARAGQPSSPKLPPGQELSTPDGTAYRIESHFGLDHQHGEARLERLLGFAPSLAAEVAGIQALEQAPIDQLIFVDLETTGLVGGAGTLGFLIGVGRFVGATFRLRQYFLRDPAEEPGMLRALAEDLDAAHGLVSFNGRVFDIPLLEMRYRLALRQSLELTGLPHLDLLHPARRLWRHGLPDCRLGTLEAHILGVRRSEQDLPGELIPGAYLDYLRTGDATEIGRVIYHNAEDVLSLVGLAAAVLHRYQAQDPQRLSSEEALAVARWHQEAGRPQPAEAAYRAALQEPDRAEIRLDALRMYTSHLKREGRREEALEGWRSWHELAPEDPHPCIELAMYFEWHALDLGQAHHWAQEALLSISRWPGGWRRDQARQQVEHRLRRLESKLSAGLS